MHISFINATLGGDYSAMDIAITALATYINQCTSHSASIIDLTFHRRHWKEYLRYKIIKLNPDVIGISTNTLYLQYVKAVAKEIKENFTLPIILGGHHASIYPEQTLALSECDAVCIGDGEFPLAEYLDRLSKRESFVGIKGIWVKENGSIIKNEKGTFNENLDIFPYPDWDLWEDLDKYFYFLGMLYLIGSRGCPYRCSYCDAHGIADAVGGKYFRLRNPENYAEEIAYNWKKYKERNLRLLQLFDPVFTMDDDWIEKFCHKYRKLGLHREIKYSVFSRIDHLNKDKIKLLADSGCAILRVGIECGNENMRRNIYKKNVSNRQIEEIFKIAKENRIALTAYYILGGPGETKKTIKETISMANRLQAERSAFFIYKPFTKEGVKQIYDLGGWIDDKKWKRVDNITFGAAVYTGELTPRQIENYQKLAYFITFGKRLISMISKQGLKYFTRLLVYMFRGFVKNGLAWDYLFTYYHIYSYDNIDK
jgi:radical SAM superfamily enzyme YgiQ (UPF0313 family)